MPIEYCRLYIHWISTARTFQDLDVHMLIGWRGDQAPQSKQDSLTVVIPRLCQLWKYADYFQDEKLKSVIVDETVASSAWRIPAETVPAFWTPKDSKLRQLIFDYLVDTTTAQSFFEDRDRWPPGLRDKMLWWMLANTSSHDRVRWNRGTREDACRYHDHEKGACPLNDSKGARLQEDTKETCRLDDSVS